MKITNKTNTLKEIIVRYWHNYKWYCHTAMGTFDIKMRLGFLLVPIIYIMQKRLSGTLMYFDIIFYIRLLFNHIFTWPFITALLYNRCLFWSLSGFNSLNLKNWEAHWWLWARILVWGESCKGIKNYYIVFFF